MLKYNPSPRHEGSGARGQKGSRLDLTPVEAEQLLNDPFNCVEVPDKRQRVGVRNGKIYVYQHDGVSGYHAYPACGNEICTKYPAIANRIATLLGTDFKRLSRMRE